MIENLFQVGHKYTKKDLYEILHVPINKRKGAWDTGYHKFGNDWFIFANIGIPGRTGHNYRNFWVGDELVWQGKTGSRISHATIQSLLNPKGKIFIFTRIDNRSPFVYEGNGLAKSWRNTHPVTIIWEFKNLKDRRPERLPEETTDSLRLKEGAVKTIAVNTYERNPVARRLCIEHYGAKCTVCSFDFEKYYGDIGSGFIYVHHIVPISDIGDEYEIDPIKDLIPICPNCHAMIHSRYPPLEISDLSKIVTRQKHQRT